MSRTRPALVICLCLTPIFLALAGGAPTQAAGLTDPLLALQLVNQERLSRGLAPLGHSSPLAEAARAHAEDMAARGYYSHISPEGEDALARYVRAGGSSWRRVDENIGYCRGCEGSSVLFSRTFHARWMESPGHRANVLDPQAEFFGFAMAVSPDGGLFAVQTFAGPGRPPPRSSGAAARAIEPATQQPYAISLINGLRAQRGLAGVEGDLSLGAAARTLLSDYLAGAAAQLADLNVEALTKLLPGDAWARWRRLGILSAVCGGCGSEPSDADVEAFVQRWAASADDRVDLIDGAFSHVGFALLADGLGLKAAVVVLGEAR